MRRQPPPLWPGHGDLELVAQFPSPGFPSLRDCERVCGSRVCVGSLHVMGRRVERREGPLKAGPGRAGPQTLRMGRLEMVTLLGSELERKRRPSIKQHSA